MDIAAFKRAFKVAAETRNRKIRWTAPTKPWQTQTSLKTVKSKLDLLDNDNPTEKQLSDISQAINGLPQDSQTKYKVALDGLKAEMSKVTVEKAKTSARPAPP
jgi:hypothetical protein